MLSLITPKRESDSYGSGEWRASRGSRTHNGIDYAAWPKSQVLSLTKGIVTKIGYPYDPNHPSKGAFRYVEITDRNSHKIRYFYVYPMIVVGEPVKVDQVIGFVQDLRDAYPNITPHVHLEVKTPDGNYTHPEDYIL